MSILMRSETARSDTWRVRYVGENITFDDILNSSHKFTRQAFTSIKLKTSIPLTGEAFPWTGRMKVLFIWMGSSAHRFDGLCCPNDHSYNDNQRHTHT